MRRPYLGRRHAQSLLVECHSYAIHAAAGPLLGQMNQSTSEQDMMFVLGGA